MGSATRDFWASNAVAQVEVGQGMSIINQQLHRLTTHKYNGFTAEHLGANAGCIASNNAQNDTTG